MHRNRIIIFFTNVFHFLSPVYGEGDVDCKVCQIVCFPNLLSSGDQEYACIWIKKRAMHVMEFKIAAVQYNYFNDTQICNDDVFIGQEWITQGRFTDSGQTNCPVLGEYTGVIPDDPELCARLSSDCRRPQFMHYAVLSCSNSSLIFEADSWAKSRTKRNNVDHVQKRRRHSREFKEGGRHRNGRNVSQERKEEEDAHFSHFDPSSGDDMKFVRASMRGSSRTYVFPASALNDSSQQNLPPVKPFTTRRPYAYEKPFYYVVDQYGNQVLDLPTSQLVAEREYQCLGQWRETSTVYTFTYRRDVKMYECFAGVVVSSDEAFIIEAGISCKRGLHPLTKGMKLVRKATCDEINNFTKSPSFMNTSVYTTVSNILEVSHTPSQPSLLPAWWPSTSRKPWLKKTTETTDKPLWKRQKPKDASNSSAVMSAELIFIVLLVSTPIWPAL